MHLDVHPNVDMFGICDNYEQMKHEWHPLPTDCVSKLIDERVDWRVEAAVPPVVENVISNELTTALSVPVVQAVTMVLSGPEASVALSAPVVSLVTGSYEICSHTIATIETALSSNELSDAMVPAVATVIPTDTVSSEVVEAAANGISIEAIIGNKFIDKNKNGYQDPDEPTIDNGAEEIVIGDELGA